MTWTVTSTPVPVFTVYVVAEPIRQRVGDRTGASKSRATRQGRLRGEVTR